MMKTIVGLDIGYGNCKLAYSIGNATAPTTVVRPSGAAPWEFLMDELDGRKALGDGVRVMVDGRDWGACVDPAWIQAGHTREHTGSYTASPEYLALALAAMSLVNQPRIDLLVTGMPVVQFYEDVERKRALIRRLEAVHQPQPGITVEVKKVMVVPQPMGAYTDMLSQWLASPEDRGRVSKPEYTTLVLDPGHFSVDYVLFQGRKPISSSSSSSNQAGRRLIEVATRQLFEQTGKRIRLDMVESAVRRGETQFEVGDRSIPLTPLIEAAAVQVIEQVMKEVLTSLGGNVDAVNAIVLAGGGAALYEPIVRRRFRGVRVAVAADPILANARGFWRAGLGSLADAERQRNAA
jgi:plasmid segregation protein ParM